MRCLDRRIHANARNATRAKAPAIAAYVSEGARAASSVLNAAVTADTAPMRAIHRSLAVSRFADICLTPNVRHERRPEASEACWRTSARWRG
jgi:hypothetical protein